MKISIIIPSIFRVSILEQCLNSLNSNIGNFDNETFLVTEDLQTKLAIENWWNTKFEKLNIVIVYNQERLGYMKAWNHALPMVTGDIVFPIGDDGILTPGALEKVVSVHQNQLGGYGVAGFNDGYIANSIVATHFITDIPFIKNELGGVLLCPLYKAHYADCEVNERAKRIGKLAWDNTAFLYHEHWTRNKRPEDEIDTAKAEWLEHDKTLFERRKATNFPNDFERVI